MTIAMPFLSVVNFFLQLMLKQLTRKFRLGVKSVDGSEVIFTPKSGKIALRRKLLKVTYWPPRFPKRRPKKKMKLDSKFGLGHVLIECGHTPHKAFEKYPDVLCGQYKQTYGWFLSPGYRKKGKKWILTKKIFLKRKNCSISGVVTSYVNEIIFFGLV